MDAKQCRTIQFQRQNRFHKQIIEKSLKEFQIFNGNITFREAIQRTKENYRDARSGGEIGRAFIGNSNKYHQGLASNKIQNRVQKRNQQKKNELFK